MKRIGLVAGSFDPVTLGHLKLIERATELCDQVYVTVAVNAKKRYMFNEQQRLNMVKRSIEKYVGCPSDVEIVVETCPNYELLVDFAEARNVTHLIRGLRNTNDFMYEEELRTFNESMNPGIRTVYFSLPHKYSLCSSSMVKSLIGTKNWMSTLESYVDKETIHDLMQDFHRTKVIAVMH